MALPSATHPTPSLRVLIDALEDIKAKDMCILDVRKQTPLYDAMIIVSGDSNRQISAMAFNAKAKWKEAGGIVLGVEGVENGEWVILDCHSVIVHIMQTPIRQYYHLEELWGTPANRIDPALITTDTALSA